MVKHGFERIADGGLVPVEMAAEEVQMKGWLHLENPLGRLFDGETGEEVHDCAEPLDRIGRSEEHTSELQSLMRISYAVFCLKKKNQNRQQEYLSYTN